MPDPKTIATISANGKIFKGWKSLNVRLQAGDAVRTFQFTCSDAKGEAAQLLPGARCVIQLGGKTVLTGWITTRGVAYDADTHDVVIGGKALSTDVAESIHAVRGGNLNGYTAEQAIRGALAPHKVDLVVKNAPPSVVEAISVLRGQPRRDRPFASSSACRSCAAPSSGTTNRGACASATAIHRPRRSAISSRATTSCDAQARSTISRRSASGTLTASSQAWATTTRPATRKAASPTRSRGRTAWSTPMCLTTPTARTRRPSRACSRPGPAGRRSRSRRPSSGGSGPTGSSGSYRQCTLYSPMALPGGANKMTLGTQRHRLLAGRQGRNHDEPDVDPARVPGPVRHAGVQSDGAGNIVSNPGTPRPSRPTPDREGSDMREMPGSGFRATTARPGARSRPSTTRKRCSASTCAASTAN